MNTATVTTVKDRLAEYDAAKRAEAKKQNKALERMSSPLLVVPAAASTPNLVFLKKDNPIPQISTGGKRGRDLTEDDIRTIVAHVFSEGGEIAITQNVFSSHAAFDAFVAFVKKVGKGLTGKDKKIERDQVTTFANATLPLSRALDWTNSLPILTDMCALKWWLPTGEDTDSLSAWAKYLVPGKSSAVTVMNDLYALLTDATGASATTTTNLTLASREERNSIYSTRNAADPSAPCASYNRAVLSHNYFRQVLNADPALRERNLISGAVSKVTLAGGTSAIVNLQLDGLISTKTGYHLTLANSQGDQIVDCVERSFAQKKGGKIVMCVEIPPKSQQEFATWKSDRGIAVYASEVGGPVSNQNKESRWNTGKSIAGAEKIEREVPFDIIVAGRPGSEN